MNSLSKSDRFGLCWKARSWNTNSSTKSDEEVFCTFSLFVDHPKTKMCGVTETNNVVLEILLIVRVLLEIDEFFV
jgi:hypothetical protein